MTNTIALKTAISMSGLKYKNLAEKLNLSSCELRKKIDNHSEFKASEIVALSSILNLTDKERTAIFFAKESDYKSQKVI